jgi:DNA-binding transcriptional LysR family regulator
MAGELNLALVTAPPDNSQITAVPFAETHLYAVLPQTHAAAQKELIALQDLARDEWILFARRVHPVIHDAILDAARREGIAPKHAHDIITPNRRFTWYLNTLAWRSSPNLRPLALALKA